MLARSRSNYIAKRAALTAPTGFLPRLLLCSGLPKASLLTMIDRLGKLGEKAPDKGKAFHQLLVPSAASEWDIGRLGHRRDVSRKLLGRLSAYARMYDISSLEGDDKASFTFLEWLSETCKVYEKPRKSKSKKTKSPSILGTSHVGEMIKANLRKELLDFDQRSEAQLEADSSDMTDFRVLCPIDEVSFPCQGCSVETLRTFVKDVFAKNAPYALEFWLEKTFTRDFVPTQAKTSRLVDYKAGAVELCLLLLQSFLELHRKAEQVTSCLLKWIPRLSRATGSEELWKTLFSRENASFPAWPSLLSKCVQSWCPFHCAQCRAWILSRGTSEQLSLKAVVRFLVNSSEQSSVHTEGFTGLAYIGGDLDWAKGEQIINVATNLALDCFEQTTPKEMEGSINSRNNPPDWVVLLLLLARSGRKQLQCVCRAVVQRIEKVDQEHRRLLLSVNLRLYAHFPLSMNLSFAVLRSILKEAVEEFADEWLVWRSPLDDQFQDMIESLVANGAPQRVLQALTDGSKKHPLLILRKLCLLELILEGDAVAGENSDKRGVIYGQSLSGPLLAKVDGNLLNVSVKHWGFNFTEDLWLAFLEVISAGECDMVAKTSLLNLCSLSWCIWTVPREVLFACGLKMGLLDFLGVYLRLMFVQSQLRTSDKLCRLKGKLSEFFDAFQASNVEGWENWLGMETAGLPSLGGTRNVLMSCNFISHQQAIDSLHKSRIAQSLAPEAKSN